jgi:hypothetical protein
MVLSRWKGAASTGFQVFSPNGRNIGSNDPKRRTNRRKPALNKYDFSENIETLFFFRQNQNNVIS